MKRLLSFLICSLIAVTVQCENLDSILFALDTCIMNRKSYEEKLVKRTDSLLKVTLENQNDSVSLDAWMKIMTLEKGHNGKKALIAINKALELAQKSGKKKDILTILINKVQILEDFGLPQEGEYILDSLLQYGNLNQTEKIGILTAKYNLYDFYRVHDLPGEISDSKLSSLKPVTDSIVKYTSEYTQAITIQYNSYDILKTIQILKQKYQLAEDRNKIILAIVISNKYSLIKNIRNRNYWWAVAAIHAIQNVQYEFEPLIRLAASLEEMGDYERAERYAQVAFENAQTFNTRIRKSEVAPVLSECLHYKSNLYNTVLHENKLWKIGFLILSIVIIMLTGGLFALYRNAKIKSLAYAKKEEDSLKVISSLKEEKEMKNEYITHFLELSLDSILKIEQFRNTVLIKLRSGDVEKLKRQITTSDQFSEFQKDCLKRFDLAFFRLYPNFTHEVNQLLREEEKIKLSDAEILNNELRILALLKLGITDATRIATILGVAVRTVYFYRNRVKNKAKNRDTFEKDLFQAKILEQ